MRSIERAKRFSIRMMKLGRADGGIRLLKLIKENT